MNSEFRTQTVSVRTPDGGEVDVEVTFELQHTGANPCDKDPARYHGEDEGWECIGVFEGKPRPSADHIIGEVVKAHQCSEAGCTLEGGHKGMHYDGERVYWRASQGEAPVAISGDVMGGVTTALFPERRGE
jgi:hypothetical protein